MRFDLSSRLPQDCKSSGAGANILDDLDESVKQKAGPEGEADLINDPSEYDRAKNQQQNFKDGKDFEARINNKPESETINEVNASLGSQGVNLTGYKRVKQVQIKLNGDGYMVADEVWVKEVTINGIKHKEVIINECKLSTSTNLSTRQNQFLGELDNFTEFEIRSKGKKTDDGSIPLIQKEKIIVKNFIKTSGDGTSNGNYTFQKLK